MVIILSCMVSCYMVFCCAWVNWDLCCTCLNRYELYADVVMSCLLEEISMKLYVGVGLL